MSSRQGLATGTLRAVNVGLRVRLHGREGEDLGFAHAPGPVALGDTLALPDGSSWRVFSLINLSQPDRPLGDLADGDRAVDVLCIVHPIEL